jgi:hypothetical protein
LKMIRKYKNLQQTSKRDSKQLNQWLLNWERVYAKTARLNLSNVQENRCVYDFLNSLRTVNVTFVIDRKTILNHEIQQEKNPSSIKNLLKKFRNVGSYWLAKEWIATAVSLKWMRNSAYYIENLSHSSIYWFSSSDPSRFIWEPRSSFVTKIFSFDQDIFVSRCHFDLISSESHIHLRIHWSLDDFENQ